MELVVDASVLFSAAIKDSKTAELLLRDDVAYHAPEYLFVEFERHRGELLEKTHRTEDEYERFVAVLKRRIELCHEVSFRSEMECAREISPDPKDVPYFALALHLDAPIWSDDLELGEQDVVLVLTTADFLETLP